MNNIYGTFITISLMKSKSGSVLEDTGSEKHDIRESLLERFRFEPVSFRSCQDDKKAKNEVDHEG